MLILLHNMHKVSIAILNHLQQILFNFTKILKYECEILILWYIYIVSHCNESSPTNFSQFHENLRSEHEF
jgi:hypothetical protein